jgi:hypothetical protein
MFDYGKALNRSWLTGTWRTLLLKGTWTPDVTAQFVSTLVPATFEATGTGYARKTLASQTINVDTVNHRADHDAAILTWTALTCTDFRYAVVYLFGTTDADSVLHSYYDFGAQAVTALDFILKWNGGTATGTVFRGT